MCCTAARGPTSTASRLRLVEVRLGKWPDPLFWVKLPLYATAQLGGQLPVLVLVLDYHWLSDLVAGLALGVLLLRVLHGIDAVALRHWPGGNGGGRAGGDGGRRAGLADRPRAGIGVAAGDRPGHGG